jgi:hypothetical protein
MGQVARKLQKSIRLEKRRRYLKKNFSINLEKLIPTFLIASDRSLTVARALGASRNSNVTYRSMWMILTEAA